MRRWMIYAIATFVMGLSLLSDPGKRPAHSAADVVAAAPAASTGARCQLNR